MSISICSLYKFGLILIITSLLAPKINIVNGFNVTILDLFPVYFFLYILLITLNKKISFRIQCLRLLFVFFTVVCVMFLSTIHGFFLFQDLLGFIKSISQFYRRFIVLILYPLFILINPCTRIDLLKFFSRYFIYFVIISGILGLFINFIEYIRSLYFNYITNSKQVFLFALYRNMGLIGEASYFADIVIFSLALFFLQRKFFSRTKSFIISSLLILILISTVSKSAVISVILSLLITSYIYIINILLEKKRRFKIDKDIILIVLLTFAISILLFFYMIPYINQILVLARSSFDSRADIMWNNFLDIFLKYNSALLLGFGFKGLKSYFGFAGAHNQYLGFLIDFGIVFSVYILIIFLFFLPMYIYRHIPKKYKYFILFMTFYLAIQSFVHEPLYHFQVLGAYICILLIFYVKLLRRNKYFYAENSNCP